MIKQHLLQQFKKKRVVKKQLLLQKLLHYDAEVYPKISALVKLARQLVTYNERN